MQKFNIHQPTSFADFDPIAKTLQQARESGGQICFEVVRAMAQQESYREQNIFETYLFTIERIEKEARLTGSFEVEVRSV